ncbi:error-prone DNA polymerase [Variovorax terrae]|uniref:Error-prone DNA polymerase n=1 Tax=Variovorax terrae TaxID=2923278 RepID=A0A9X1VV34_9BURK|nr:error-prone DNA polymerase [Variovorax terrae]MCJ0763500.1 error-prone DNA polymerase [Variovorax terrae]
MPEAHDKPQPDTRDDEDELPPVLSSGPDRLPRYAELHALSNFSFQRGASHPWELVQRAYNLGYEALALTDECSVAGVVRAWSGLNRHLERIRQLEAQDPAQRRLRPFTLLYGSEFALEGGRLIALARDLGGWGGLCEFITAARTGDAAKGEYRVGWEHSDFSLLAGCEILFAPGRPPGGAIDLEAFCDRLTRTSGLFPSQNLWLAAELLHGLDDDLWLATLQEAGARCGVPLVAAGDVHMHKRSRKRLQDVITAVRVGRPVADCGFALQPNAERHLRTRLRLAETYPPELLEATLEVARHCGGFDLKSIRYDYPLETVPAGLTPAQALRQLAFKGAAERYPRGVPAQVNAWLEKELALIATCQYEMFFLTVHDIVRFARSKHILCQGRGSAANSVVCYCLGVTAADPMHSNPLLERFISEDRRNEPPDIDVDFEHERREEVIQYIYAKYGRERAAIAAVVIGYRTRSAIRDVGKALGLDEPLIDACTKDHQWFDDALASQRLATLAQQAGTPLDARQAQLWVELTHQLIGFPRHLSQHVGGFVLTQTRLTRLVPVENASMVDRSVIQWDKDDLEDMGLMKVDVLALGMLSAIRRCLDFVSQRRGQSFTRYDIGAEDEETYDMICRADTVGVFQIESRAQMSMLPRLKPRIFYDLVVEVAIVRPGPISGGMVHPYLQARRRKEQNLAIEYERSSLESAAEPPRLQKALERTLGIPIFQEQVMEIAMIAAGFSATEADALRRGMAAWKRTGDVKRFGPRLIDGMLARGYTLEFAQRIFQQIQGFGEYGFPESHAYSFALLAYESSWLKRHEPECFLAALLNSQPMGFYTPSQLIQDAQRHGVQVLPADVSHSDWDCTLETAPTAATATARGVAVRLGLRLVGRLGKEAAQRVPAARAQAPFTSTEDLGQRAQLDARDLDALAAADALQSLSGHRRQQVWDAAAQHRAPALLRGAPVNEEALWLAPAPEAEEITFDYAATGLTLRRHPLALLRPKLARRGLLNADELKALPHGRWASACGLVTVRQQPQTAKGTIFVTLEDETGPVNVIVWRHVREQQREALLKSRLLAVRGIWQRDDPQRDGSQWDEQPLDGQPRSADRGGQVCHLIAHRLLDLTPLLGRLGGQSGKSRDFH